MNGTRYVFTLNNYTDDEIVALRRLEPIAKYLIFGREVGETGTPHLQGFIVFKTNHRFNAVKRTLGDRYHIEKARGSTAQAADYCKKDGDYEEFGTAPTTPPGKTNRFDEFKKWVLEQPSKPSPQTVAAEFPSIFLQYGRCMEWIDLIYPSTFDVGGEYRDHQRHLADILDGPADDRHIIFVVDETGGTGKSWFIKKYMSEHDDTQVLSIGKRDDLAHAISERKRVFLFDLPRSSSEFLQYSVLEQLKDRLVFSPKYMSKTKMLEHMPHVVVFMNEHPDRNKLSRDRYILINWLGL